MTKSVVAGDVGDGIRCNAVCPGTADCPSMRDRLPATGDFDKAHKAFVVRQPTGRLGKPEEIAELVCYLASDGSALTTAQGFAVDGGWST